MTDYDLILEFTRKILNNFGIRSYVADKDALADIASDNHLREHLFSEFNRQESSLKLLEQCEDQTIYFSEDSFGCRYTLLKLPDIEPDTYFLAGPYMFHTTDRQFLLGIQQKLGLSSIQAEYIKSYYREVPFIAFEDYLRSTLLLLAEEIYGGVEHYTIGQLKGATSDFSPLYCEPVQEKYDLLEYVEKQYASEQALMSAIASGNFKEVELFISKALPFSPEQRLTNQLRDQKNYLIIYNTILRKAAENGGVHPIYLDDISSQFAHKIEQITGEAQQRVLMREMPRKYCLLVRSYSTKGYSPIIQKIMNYIPPHLSEDLGLKELSELFSINSTYLSALFKKETGSTLTGFVNGKRMEHALFLLNSTELYIQTIAASCGIPDLNYFTKIFKKQTGMTPSEYRAMIHRN